MAKDYYEILGVSKTDDIKKIKKAYKKLAIKYHPDKNPDDSDAEEKFKEASEAYSVLSDEGKRRDYDNRGTFRPFRPGGFSRASTGFRGFDDILREFSGYGGPRQPSGQTQISEVQVSASISFKESILGTNKKISFSYQCVCYECKGSGLDASSEYIRCQTCGSSGKIKSEQGPISVYLTCHKCRGRGWSSSRPCKTCNGPGRITNKQVVDAKIPAGICNGNILRIIKSENNLIILIKIIVEASKGFVRYGNDIHSELDITLTEALLGCSKSVELIRRKTNIKIPECIQPGTKIKVKSEGATEVNGPRKGDHYVKVNVRFPKRLTERQKKLFKGLEEELS